MTITKIFSSKNRKPANFFWDDIPPGIYEWRINNITSIDEEIDKRGNSGYYHLKMVNQKSNAIFRDHQPIHIDIPVFSFTKSMNQVLEKTNTDIDFNHEREYVVEIKIEKKSCRKIIILSLKVVEINPISNGELTLLNYKGNMNEV